MSQLRDCNSSKDYYLTENQLEQLKQDFKNSSLIVQKLLQEQKNNALSNLLASDRQAEAGITAEQDALYGIGNPDADLYAKVLQIYLKYPSHEQWFANWHQH